MRTSKEPLRDGIESADDQPGEGSGGDAAGKERDGPPRKDRGKSRSRAEKEKEKAKHKEGKSGEPERECAVM
jgi:hypothetical protein